MAAIFDFEKALSPVVDLCSDMGAFAVSVLPYIVGIVGAFIVFWLIYTVVKVIRDWSEESADGERKERIKAMAARGAAIAGEGISIGSLVFFRGCEM